MPPIWIILGVSISFNQSKILLEENAKLQIQVFFLKTLSGHQQLSSVGLHILSWLIKWKCVWWPRGLENISICFHFLLKLFLKFFQVLSWRHNWILYTKKKCNPKIPGWLGSDCQSCWGGSVWWWNWSQRPEEDIRIRIQKKWWEMSWIRNLPCLL